MKAKLFPTKESAEKYIQERELKTATIKECYTDRSDPRWTRKSYAVIMSNEEYFKLIYRD